MPNEMPEPLYCVAYRYRLGSDAEIERTAAWRKVCAESLKRRWDYAFPDDEHWIKEVKDDA